MSLFEQIEMQCKAAKAASAVLATADGATRSRLLCRMADAICRDREAILAANQEDLSHAEENGVSVAMQDRLRLTEGRINAMADALRALAALPDPLGGGEVFTRPNGLLIRRVRVPLGCVGMIYEARPNVTTDAAGLCVLTGNAAVLRGGKEAICSNKALVSSIETALEAEGLPTALVTLITDTTRESANTLMEMRGLIDVLIPRGGKGLIRAVVEGAKVPVIETGAGNCHMYIDRAADLDMAVKLTLNAKAQRPSVCNAIETLLVHTDIAEAFLPKLQRAFDVIPHAVELRGCPRTRSVLPGITAATVSDWETEYDDYILAIRVVDSLSEAVDHICAYTTHHSEAIITEDRRAAMTFTEAIDAACVYVNASTRFTDGEEFGLGAEIGISTQKLHARGPMGPEALTTVKYIIDGDGQTRG